MEDSRRFDYDYYSCLGEKGSLGRAGAAEAAVAVTLVVVGRMCK